MNKLLPSRETLCLPMSCNYVSVANRDFIYQRRAQQVAAADPLIEDFVVAGLGFGVNLRLLGSPLNPWAAELRSVTPLIKV
jgi:hypothetical protein